MESTFIASELKDAISTGSRNSLFAPIRGSTGRIIYPKPSCSKASRASFFVGPSETTMQGTSFQISRAAVGPGAAAFGLIITTKSAFHCLKLSVSAASAGAILAPVPNTLTVIPSRAAISSWIRLITWLIPRLPIFIKPMLTIFFKILC
ncbi:hypothetical protein SDC9_124530 [bioreactor metagenome]|uniref:Uncharacterized protein n=1 Tax=bioreactor metagenome TaxID=1076179 RepID=A0A645CKQ4_9ZZZZ